MEQPRHADSPLASAAAVSPPLAARFRDLLLRQARFREDAELADALASEAEPVVEALATALRAEPAALHEPYSLLTLLARNAAERGATPGVALALVDALGQLLEERGVSVERARLDELTLVAVEGYCAARDERTTRQLRAQIADNQIAVELAPHCWAVFLTGSPDDAELDRSLERIARDLLRGDARSCLLDVSRLDHRAEDVARALGRFCAQCATLGVCSFVVGASPELQGRFVQWSVGDGPVLFVDEVGRARTLALAAAGVELLPMRRWPRWFLPTRRGSVR